MSETPTHRGIIVLSPSLNVPERDLNRLRHAGYVPLIGEPEQVRLVAPTGEMDGNLLTLAALKTCNVNDTRQREFGQLVLKSLVAQFNAPAEDPRP